jgi:hypothetical protein
MGPLRLQALPNRASQATLSACLVMLVQLCSGIPASESLRAYIHYSTTLNNGRDDVLKVGPKTVQIPEGEGTFPERWPVPCQ